MKTFNKINFKNLSSTNLSPLCVVDEIILKFPNQTFYQREFLYTLFNNSTDFKSKKIRTQLFNNPTLHYLLDRKIEEIETPFGEEQNDTADILIVKNDFYEIIDIKTRNVSKSAQSPNIISAYKLAQVCAKMLDNKEFDNFTINYFGIDWELDKDKLVCKDAHFACLFKSNPVDLYINWAAAMQIQFHVCDLDQTFIGSMENWARSYLKHFVTQAKKRAKAMTTKFVKPFEKYIK